MAVPVVSRLRIRDWLALFLGVVFLCLEGAVRLSTVFLPASVLDWIRAGSATFFHRYVFKPEPQSFTKKLACAPGFVEMCALFGYEAEEHVVPTRDGFMLGLHRLPRKKEESLDDVPPGRQADKGHRKPVVYLHHGLMMNSEIWVAPNEEHRSLPFALVQMGYDVWLGNNRGNKYSKKHTSLNSSQKAFWDFSIDEFAMFDIPDSIRYILDTTGAPSLAYIGFSQGTAQAFAMLSINPQLNEKVNLFVGLAPAMSPAGLHNPIVDALMKSSPGILFSFFGHKSLLPSTMFWQMLIYPPIFVRIIDACTGLLFGWTNNNSSFAQKVVSYNHLYSFTSVKALVHWFQIIRSQKFQMYDDDSSLSLSLTSQFYRVARFPTKNIHTPIALIYGGSDSLVDINAMLRELPRHTVAHEIPKYEHLDLIWADDVDELVFPHVFDILKNFAETLPSSVKEAIDEVGVEEALAPQTQITAEIQEKTEMPPHYELEEPNASVGEDPRNVEMDKDEQEDREAEIDESEERSKAVANLEESADESVKKEVEQRFRKGRGKKRHEGKSSSRLGTPEGTKTPHTPEGFPTVHTGKPVEVDDKEPAEPEASKTKAQKRADKVLIRGMERRLSSREAVPQINTSPPHSPKDKNGPKSPKVAGGVDRPCSPSARRAAELQESSFPSAAKPSPNRRRSEADTTGQGNSPRRMLDGRPHYVYRGSGLEIGKSKPSVGSGADNGTVFTSEKK
ncbi:alpha/beta-hydrolase [Saitoella complicata NRRL Y-17804]|uniref:AB hydrolase-1 domain-containing protein n=1 Tax=Saitoella complicata (strain BCRC 22490 / CBS 7301 / JCM 7358 / NBRC 10748 / NRRL Y-17804) TaxID=698492 RepID=A0A0E9NKJ6_SAICN|nr:alpha/beta-hydrolase [Saitoella complicata NRRL Y-17804]ODQ52757.1 alpha/beta-hydrolase [Saitoella complicata NRRL Y-17804]GAO50359.1 hypothetical protein G7K_4486-t1 [Saitoella complicata NRRL Y-17804]